MSGTSGRISGSDRRSLCSAAAIAMARSRSRLTRSDWVRAVHHRNQRGHAKLGRLLDEPVEAGALDRREDQPDIRAGFGRAALFDRLQRAVTAPQRVDLGIETRHRAR